MSLWQIYAWFGERVKREAKGSACLNKVRLNSFEIAGAMLAKSYIVLVKNYFEVTYLEIICLKYGYLD